MSDIERRILQNQKVVLESLAALLSAAEYLTGATSMQSNHLEATKAAVETLNLLLLGQEA